MDIVSVFCFFFGFVMLSGMVYEFGGRRGVYGIEVHNYATIKSPTMRSGVVNVPTSPLSTGIIF